MEKNQKNDPQVLNNTKTDPKKNPTNLFQDYKKNGNNKNETTVLEDEYEGTEGGDTYEDLDRTTTNKKDGTLNKKTDLTKKTTTLDKEETDGPISKKEYEDVDHDHDYKTPIGDQKKQNRNPSYQEQNGTAKKTEETTTKNGSKDLNRNSKD